jgi:steroid 5-alpha reductase family enzyme
VIVESVSVHVLLTCLAIYLGVCLGVLLLSIASREYSWVDRIWSVVPVGYVGIFAGQAGFADARLDVLFGLVALWGLRLTFNFARKGGYAAGGEDYRWAVLRDRLAPWRFQLFNVGFITFYQNAILLLITLPAYTALLHHTSFGPLDVLFTVLFLVFLVGETVADQQQWNFQQRKKAAIASGREPEQRFVQAGLFRYSRHPNFFCDLAQWWMVFAFGAVAAGSVVQWTVAGAFLLTLLSVGSTIFTESISRDRYPEYADYQRRTSPVLPWFPRAKARQPR